MAVVSRLQLNHPALGSAGGVGLHASIEALYTKIGDNMNDRWFSITDFDQTETEDLLHNFETDISNIQYDLWNYTGSEWVHLTEATTPKRSDFTVVEKTGAEDTTLQITNNTGGDNLTFAVSLTFGSVRLDQGDIQDVDVTSTPPEDGQALVYDVATGKFRPGASGDASFKIQGVSDPNATIKGGFIILDDGRELATYDGSGGASTDYGKDLTVSLDTILGGNPADATTYYLYIDLNTLSSEVTFSDNGRKVFAVVESNFHLSTTAPEFKNKSRYVAIGFIRSATTGTVWSGTGAAFGTLATRRHNVVVGTSLRNYASDWYNGKLGVGAVTSGITATGNITPSSSWKASNTSLLTIANVTSGGLREGYSLRLDNIAAGAAFVQLPEFTLDTVDLGKPVSVSFDHGAFTTADDYQVYIVRYNSSGVYQESIPITGTASATSPFSAQLPAGSVGTFQGFFIARSEATDLYALRYARNSASDTTDVLIDSLYVGPQSVVQGAAITDWQSYTPTLSNTTNNATKNFFWRQDGQDMLIVGQVSWSGAGAGSAFTVSIPSGYQINTTVSPPSLSGGNFGNTLWYDIGTTAKYLLPYPYSATAICFFETDVINSTWDGTQAANGDALAIACRVPIVGWSSNVVMANRAVEEYSYNSSTNTTTSDTSSFAYGANGALIGSITATLNRRVRFTTPILSTDVLICEVSSDRSKWIPANTRFPGHTENINQYGIVLFAPINSTDVDVSFGAYSDELGKTTVGGAGRSWATFGGAYYWRVRKVSGGASVGFPVGIENIVDVPSTGRLFYATTTVDISSNGSFSAAQPVIKFTRIGNVVTMTWEALAHSSVSSATATAVVPVGYRPAAQIAAVFQNGGTVAAEMNVFSTGNIEVEYRNSSQTLTAQTSTGTGGSMTWIV